MPTLNLRRVGMSYLIEGFADRGIDARVLLGDLAERFGLAVAPMCVRDDSPEADGDVPDAEIDAVIIDSKVTNWDDLRSRIESSVQLAGFGYTAWSERGMPTGPCSVLHYHPDPPAEEETVGGQ